MKTILSLLILCLLWVSCTGPKKYRIGVSQCSEDEWRAQLNREIEREVLMNADRAEVEILAAYDDPDLQRKHLRSFIDRDFDIIITAPVNETCALPELRQAREKGIPVIVFDRGVKGKDYRAFIGADNSVLGASAAKYIASRLPGGRGTVIELTGLLSSTPGAERHSGFLTGLKQNPGLSLLASEDARWQTGDVRRLLDSLMQTLPAPDAVFAHNDHMAMTARQTLDSLGFPGVLVVGVDGVPSVGIKAVKDSLIDATFIYPTGGHELMATAFSILEGKPYHDSLLLSSRMPVTPENAETLLLLNRTAERETERIAHLSDDISDYLSSLRMQRWGLIFAICLIVLAVVFILFQVRSLRVRRRLQVQLHNKNSELEFRSQQLEELNKKMDAQTTARIAFFTNVSHDLRTPLTLLSTPLEEIRKASNLTERQKSLLEMSHKNLLVLKRLVNQILDFRRFESDTLPLETEPIPLAAKLREWVAAFRPVSLQRHIALSESISLPENLRPCLDADKLERIIFNLLANAFQHTPENGKISVAASQEGETVQISIQNSGRPIPGEELPKIFEQFHRADRIRPEGSGLGLTLVKAFVEMHGGSIGVTSEPKQGTCFTFNLPLNLTAANGEKVVEINKENLVTTELASTTTSGPTLPIDAEAPTLLIIDDNEDLRSLVESIMGEKYHVQKAASGAEGIRLATRYVPDLIICDIMMPDMDGFQTLEALRTELVTSHIPVLMLTAAGQDEQKIKAYGLGADAYITKPFDADMLRARVASLLASHRRNESQPAYASPNPEATPDFLETLRSVIDREMGNPDLNVETLGEAMGMSRVQLYRKVKALTNYSPVELLRNHRLEEARRRLVQSQATVSEIAYAVGFSSPGYFSKCFRDRYGINPSDLQASTSRLK